MKVVKDSKMTKIKCPHCKAVLEIHDSDYINSNYSDLDGYCKCAACGKTIFLSRSAFTNRISVRDVW